VALRPQAWKPLMDDDRAGILMAALFLLNGDREIADDAADENGLLAEAADMIPNCVAGIHEFWQEYQKPRSRQVRRRAEASLLKGRWTGELWPPPPTPSPPSRAGEPPVVNSQGLLSFAASM
jgi:hypothetical protein